MALLQFLCLIALMTFADTVRREDVMVFNATFNIYTFSYVKKIIYIVLQ